MDVESMPEHAEIGQRFMAGFPQFVEQKNVQAVLESMSQEFEKNPRIQTQQFVQMVLDRMGEVPITEKSVTLTLDTPERWG